MLLVGLLVNHRLFVIKFLGSQKLYTHFLLHGGGVSVPLIPMLWKGQLKFNSHNNCMR